MERRDFLTSTLGATLVAAAGNTADASAQSQTPAGAKTPEFYVWRQYTIKTGTQPRRLAEFLQGAAIPALNRLGHTPIGVFEVTFGLPTPTVFVLTPSSSLESLLAIESGLERDEVFMKAADPYLNAPASDPVYVRQELSLLTAFPNVPRIEIPAATAAKGPRLFELRTYESHNERAHRAKVRMFTDLGEVDIFRKVGLTPVFFARTFVGPRCPAWSTCSSTRTWPDARRAGMDSAPARSGKSVGHSRLRRRRDRVEHHDGVPAARRPTRRSDLWR